MDAIFEKDELCCGRCYWRIGALRIDGEKRWADLPTGFVLKRQVKDEIWELPRSRRGEHAYHHLEVWHSAGAAPGSVSKVPRPASVLMGIGRLGALKVVCSHCNRPNEL